MVFAHTCRLSIALHRIHNRYCIYTLGLELGYLRGYSRSTLHYFHNFCHNHIWMREIFSLMALIYLKFFWLNNEIWNTTLQVFSTKCICINFAIGIACRKEFSIHFFESQDWTSWGRSSFLGRQPVSYTVIVISRLSWCLINYKF